MNDIFKNKKNYVWNTQNKVSLQINQNGVKVGAYSFNIKSKPKSEHIEQNT